RSWFQRATVLSVANAVHQVQRFKDAIAQRSSPGLASNRANRQAQTDASVTIRPLILTPAQWVSQICTETDVLAADVLLYPRHCNLRLQCRTKRPPGLSSVGVGSNWAVLQSTKRGQCIALDPTAEVASSRRNSAS